MVLVLFFWRISKTLKTVKYTYNNLGNVIIGQVICLNSKPAFLINQCKGGLSNLLILVHFGGIDSALPLFVQTHPRLEIKEIDNLHSSGYIYFTDSI